MGQSWTSEWDREMGGCKTGRFLSATRGTRNVFGPPSIVAHAGFIYIYICIYIHRGKTILIENNNKFKKFKIWAASRRTNGWGVLLGHLWCRLQSSTNRCPFPPSCSCNPTFSNDFPAKIYLKSINKNVHLVHPIVNRPARSSFVVVLWYT